MYIAAQLCWVTCCPEAANRSAQRVGNRQLARGQSPAIYQSAPTFGVVRAPQQPIQVVQHVPVAQAQPVYVQQAAPQVIIHQSNTGASKTSQPRSAAQKAAQLGGTAAKSLISGAKGLFAKTR